MFDEDSFFFLMLLPRLPGGMLRKRKVAMRSFLGCNKTDMKKKEKDNLWRIYWQIDNEYPELADQGC